MIWNYQRKEPKKHYNVYLHYDLDGFPDKLVKKVGEIMAFSPEQAAHLVSMQNGDDGKRDIQYKGYSVRYEAIEC